MAKKEMMKKAKRYGAPLKGVSKALAKEEKSESPKKEKSESKAKKKYEQDVGAM